MRCITNSYNLLIINILIHLIWINFLFAADRLPVSPPTTIELKKQLNRQIDSLDIEKQLRKCNGQNIEDIEQQQSLLLDSIKSIRIAIQNEVLLLERNLKTDRSISINTFLDPQSVFDWVIIITSSIAVISLLFLIYVIFIFSRKRKQRQTPSIKNRKTPLNSNKTAVKLEKNEPASNHDIELLNQLGRRTANKPVNFESQINRPETQILKNTPPQSEKLLTNDLEGQILNAYRNGLDIQEISRQFHISVDHASLILKIKGITPQK